MGQSKRASGVYSNHQISVLEENGQTLSYPKDIANCVAASLSNISSSSNYPPQFLSHKSIAENIKIDFKTNSQFPYNSNITFKELTTALQNSNKSSPVMMVYHIV